MGFVKRQHSSTSSGAANDRASPTSRGTGTRSIAMYSMVLSLVAMLQVSRNHPSYLLMTNEMPPELADGRPVEVRSEKSSGHIETRAEKERYSKPPPVDKPSNITMIRKNEVLSVSDHAIMHISNENTTNIPTIPVVVWPYVESGAKNAVSKHLEENGVKESTYLELSEDLWNFDPNVVWIGNLGVTSCDKFHNKVREAKDKRAELGLALQWPIFIIDWSDYSVKKRCKKVEEEMGPDLVKYSQRSIVEGRKWNKKKGWVDFGQRLKDSDLARYRPMPYFVRTDTIEELDSVLKEQYNMTLASPIERLERNMDVSHFWPLNMKGVRNIHCNLRKKVSRVIADTGKEANLTTFVELAGKAVKKGRNKVQSAYVEAMLEAKIIVVTQRDNWEDHYRLMEALISGAMVMTDRMLSLPHGLENGTSVVEFDSAQDLRSKILFYTSHPKERVEIARKGREVSMLQHRTWHRIEEIIFGKPLSDCSGVDPGNPCPYIVHADEARARVDASISARLSQKNSVMKDYSSRINH